ncbi:MAG: TrkH family potassium uptake protein, partial [Desulfovibrionaceae bacterium]
MRSRLMSPFWMPVWFFLAGILSGTVALHAEASRTAPLAWIDALFTATSALCVTGLSVVDTGSFFTTSGQTVILVLIQVGGLGIMTFTSLTMYLLGRRVSLTDRIAVGQSLLHDPAFKLSTFLVRVVIGTLALEGAGALALWSLDPHGFGPFSAVFHSISAFCNAGFGLYSDSLMAWRTDWGVNLVFMALITLGGLGFAVLNECGQLSLSLLRGRRPRVHRAHWVSWHTRVVLTTSLALALGGAALIFISEVMGGEVTGPWKEQILSSLFTSVTCRTAGFNTINTPHMTNVSLILMLGLMFIGGSPGSCAGGVKTTSARVWLGLFLAQLRGRSQVKVSWYALSRPALNRAFTLIVFASALVLTATLILTVTEGGDIPHPEARGQLLDVLFEVVSAFGTVGLSTGLTAKLTLPGKWVICGLMFIGRLGPIWLLSALQSWQQEPKYRLPE